MVTPILVQSTLHAAATSSRPSRACPSSASACVEPTPDWGRMFATGAEVYQSDITYMFFPGVAMVIFVVAFNLLGDSVRDAFDPKSGR